MSDFKKRKRIIAQIYKNVFKRKCECIETECNNGAINSHLLQQNGILYNVTDFGHLVEMKPTDIHRWTPDKDPITMKRVGIRTAFTIPLFCDKHDSVLFKSIEKHPINFHDYSVQLLFSYRVVCAEIRKKETVIELNKRMLSSANLRGQINEKELNTLIKGNELGINDLEKYKVLLEKEMSDLKDQFVFFVYKYPLIKIYCSAAFSPIDINTDPEQEEPFDSVFIHVIPYDDSLIIIAGYHKEHVTDWIKNYVAGWNDLESNQLEIRLTDLFVAHVENWGMSPKIYKNIESKTLDQFMKYRRENSLNHSPNQTTEVNLFENDNYGT